MGTRVMKHVVMGVQEELVTNRKEPAVLVVNKTGQGVYVMFATRHITDLPALWNAI